MWARAELADRWMAGPAFRAAFRTWATKFFGLGAFAARVRPGRTRNSFSPPLIAPRRKDGQRGAHGSVQAEALISLGIIAQPATDRPACPPKDEPHQRLGCRRGRAFYLALCRSVPARLLCSPFLLPRSAPRCACLRTRIQEPRRILGRLRTPSQCEGRRKPTVATPRCDPKAASPSSLRSHLGNRDEQPGGLRRQGREIEQSADSRRVARRWLG